MLAHVAAIRSAIEAKGFATYFVDVPDPLPEFRYVLVWLPPSGVAAETPVCGAGGDVEVVVGLTVVGATPEAVLAVSRTGVTGVFGTGDPAPLTVDGRRVWMSLEDVRPVQVDRDVTIPSTNRHPAFSVHLYRMLSIPAPDEDYSSSS